MTEDDKKNSDNESNNSTDAKADFTDSVADSMKDVVEKKIEKLPKDYKDLTRYLSEEEKKRIESIEVSEDDLNEFMEMLKNGLLRAASSHDNAVQDNFALRAETVIRLSRPVYNEETGEVEHLVGEQLITSGLRAKKIYKS